MTSEQVAIQQQIAGLVRDLYLNDKVKPLIDLTDKKNLDFFLSIVRHNKVDAYIFTKLKAFGMSLPGAAMESLEKSHQQIKKQNQDRLLAGMPILHQMKASGVEVIILKGNALAEEVFGDIGYKPMNDIDILIKKSDLKSIRQIYHDHQLLLAAALDENLDKQAKISHHWPPFFNRNLSCFLGTHWNIVPPQRGLDIPIESMWKTKEEFLLMGEKFYRLSPHYFLLHLCVHLSPIKTGLKELGDIVQLIEFRKKDLDPHVFVKIISDARAQKAVYEALSMAATLKESFFTEEVLRQLESSLSKKEKQNIDHRSSSVLRILLSRSTYISKIEKSFALFMLTEKPLEKTLLLAKMWRYYLFVPFSEAYRLNYTLPTDNAFKKMGSVFLAPFRISQVFAKDLGWGIFIFVTLRHQWVLLKCYIKFCRSFFSGEKILGLKELAEELGIQPSKYKEISMLE